MAHPTEVQVTLVGIADTEPEFMICANGQPRASFRLTVPERRFDRTADAWLTARLNTYRVVCWRSLAEHASSSIGKGDPVVVTGRQRVVDWARDGRRGTVVEIDAATIGHDLRCGTSRFQRVIRRGGLPGTGAEPADEFLLEQQFPGLAEAKAAAAAEIAAIAAATATPGARDTGSGTARPVAVPLAVSERTPAPSKL
jgi:single-strand DNA-binding protein